jgi:cephalosporin hydroxylase
VVSMAKVKYNLDALDKNPAFDRIRSFLLNNGMDGEINPLNYLDLYSSDGSDIQSMIKPMYDLTCEIKPTVIVELGVRWGNSTVSWLAYCYTVGESAGARLYSVDTEDCHVAKMIIGALGLINKWYFTQMNDIDYVKTCTWGMNRGNKCIDLLFIDTDHTYELTRKELELYSPYVRKGGVILFHDSYMEGVKRGYEEFLRDHPNWVSIYDNKFLPVSGKVIKRVR